MLRTSICLMENKIYKLSSHYVFWNWENPKVKFTQLSWSPFCLCDLSLFITGLSSTFVTRSVWKLGGVKFWIYRCKTPLQPDSDFSGARISTCVAPHLHDESVLFTLALQDHIGVGKQHDWGRWTPSPENRPLFLWGLICSNTREARLLLVP